MKKKFGFSLAEMMIVMLIVAIVLAATAPMITRKVSRERSDKIFDMLNVDPTNAVEYVKGRNQRIFMNGRTDGYIGIRETGETIPSNSVLFGKSSYSDSAKSLIGIGFDTTIGNNSVVIGYKAAAPDDSVVIGITAGKNSSGDTGTGNNIVAIGKAAGAGTNGVAIGYDSTAGQRAVAVGFKSKSSSSNATAIGYNAVAEYANSTAIGAGARTEYENTLVLGTEQDTVYIPGNLIVGKTTMLAAKSVLDGKAYPLYAMTRYGHDGDGRQITDLLSVAEHNHADDYKGGADFPMAMIRKSTPGAQIGPYVYYGRSWKSGHGDNQKICPPTSGTGDWKRIGNGNCSTPGDTARDLLYSDIRLKDVGETFTSGLNELNKLNFYHFTFKDDKDKTPQVGVIAQDLQKVFPNAVTTAEDGYLKIRWDEMFYSVINAVKELNSKISAMADKVQNISNELANLKSTVEKQQVIIDNQQTKIKDLSVRIEKLEHYNK